VLALLVAHAGQVVTREELRRNIWPTDVYVAFDQGLNNAIKKVRDAWEIQRMRLDLSRPSQGTVIAFWLR
jgi:DNA-binding winged helix-turn-helix (wHTH) protein